jgi:hypothetical protein
MFAGIMAVYIGIAIAFIIINIVLLIWVYRDAQKRNMNAAVWLLIVFVTGCIGCCIYLIVREPEGTPQTYYKPEPTLGSPPPPPITGSARFCPSCGTEQKGDVSFCTACGTKL